MDKVDKSSKPKHQSIKITLTESTNMLSRNRIGPGGGVSYKAQIWNELSVVH